MLGVGGIVVDENGQPIAGAVPTLSRWMLLILVALLGGLALVRLR